MIDFTGLWNSSIDTTPVTPSKPSVSSKAAFSFSESTSPALSKASLKKYPRS